MGANMRRHLLCGVAASAITTIISGPLAAADLPVKAAPAPRAVVPACVWCGWYVGGHIGQGWAKISATPHEFEEDDGVVDTKPKGLVGGMHLGGNYQNGIWVVGIEGDLDAAGLDAVAVFPGDNERTFTTNVKSLASVRGRLGLAFDRWLVYGTGGAGYTRGRFLGVSPSGTRTFGSFKKWGSVWGGGIEWKAAQNFSVRLEGLRYNFNQAKGIYGSNNEDAETGECCGLATFKNVTVWRVGVTHHFDPFWPAR